jgi:hypothetical protein
MQSLFVAVKTAEKIKIISFSFIAIIYIANLPANNCVKNNVIFSMLVGKKKT